MACRPDFSQAAISSRKDELTAAENLRFYAQLYDVPEPAQRAATLLARVELTHVADVQVGLSSVARDTVTRCASVPSSRIV